MYNMTKCTKCTFVSFFYFTFSLRIISSIRFAFQFLSGWVVMRCRRQAGSNQPRQEGTYKRGQAGLRDDKREAEKTKKSFSGKDTQEIFEFASRMSLQDKTRERKETRKSEQKSLKNSHFFHFFVSFHLFFNVLSLSWVFLIIKKQAFFKKKAGKK